VLDGEAKNSQTLNFANSTWVSRPSPPDSLEQNEVRRAADEKGA
jgi:hypothetical protein